MFTYKKENQLPIKSWIPEEQYYNDKQMVEQLENLSKLPFAFHHIVICPDGHVGYGMPIGGVIATKDVVIPNAVGVDIGCGMCAVESDYENITQDQLKEIMGEIRKQIPVGFSHHSKKQDESFMPKTSFIKNGIVESEYQNALTQVGTLGGGNHFIELQVSDTGHFWVMIHSGSRNLGLKVAKHYNLIAQELCKKWYSSIPECKGEDGLAFLPLDSREGKDYLNEMQYCVDFALANRKLMMERILEIVKKTLPEKTRYYPMINIAHNYAVLENHYDKNVMVHRKGATLARKGIIGIIPGSMGTFSYIVQGLGNPESFESCSHGAGRRMGRHQAIKELNLEHEQEIMKDVLGAPRTQNDLEEAPSAYKDILDVMENQKDLVKILVQLKPLAVIKG